MLGGGCPSLGIWVLRTIISCGMESGRFLLVPWWTGHSMSNKGRVGSVVGLYCLLLGHGLVWDTCTSAKQCVGPQCGCAWLGSPRTWCKLVPTNLCRDAGKDNHWFLFPQRYDSQRPLTSCGKPTGPMCIPKLSPRTQHHVAQKKIEFPLLSSLFSPVSETRFSRLTCPLPLWEGQG